MFRVNKCCYRAIWKDKPVYSGHLMGDVCAKTRNLPPDPLKIFSYTFLFAGAPLHSCFSLVFLHYLWVGQGRLDGFWPFLKSDSPKWGGSAWFHSRLGWNKMSFTQIEGIFVETPLWIEKTSTLMFSFLFFVYHMFLGFLTVDLEKECPISIVFKFIDVVPMRISICWRRLTHRPPWMRTMAAWKGSEWWRNPAGNPVESWRNLPFFVNMHAVSYISADYILGCLMFFS